MTNTGQYHKDEDDGNCCKFSASYHSSFIKQIAASNDDKE